MVTRINETLRYLYPYPISYQVGQGVTNTAVTYDYTFSETPSGMSIVLEGTMTGNVTPSGGGGGVTDTQAFISAKSATGHTVTASGNVTYTYTVIGFRE